MLLLGVSIYSVEGGKEGRREGGREERERGREGERKEGKEVGSMGRKDK